MTADSGTQSSIRVIMVHNSITADSGTQSSIRVITVHNSITADSGTQKCGVAKMYSGFLSNNDSKQFHYSLVLARNHAVFVSQCADP